jgi:hypothetical protein
MKSLSHSAHRSAWIVAPCTLLLGSTAAFGQNIGTTYCSPGNNNSTGGPGFITAMGSTVPANNNVVLAATGLPINSFGYFLTSQTQGFIPNPGGSQGDLCLGGAIGRYTGPGQVKNSGATGSFSLILDLTQTPTPTGFVSVAPGNTWNFTTWHRDSVGGLATSNLTDGLSILFGGPGTLGTLQSIVPPQGQGGDLVILTITGIPPGTAAEDFCTPKLFGVSLQGDQLTARVVHTEQGAGGLMNIGGAIGDGVLINNPTPIPGLGIAGPVSAIFVDPAGPPIAGQVQFNATETAGATATPWQLIAGELKATLSNNWVTGQRIQLELHVDTNLNGVTRHCDFFSLEIRILSPNPTANQCALAIASHIQFEITRRCPEIQVNVTGSTICIVVPGGSITNNHPLNKIIVLP